MRMRAIINKLRYKKKRWLYSSHLFFSHFENVILAISYILGILGGVASAACLVVLTVYIGYNLSFSDRSALNTVLRVAQGIFASGILFNLFFRFRSTVRQNRIIKWIVDIAVIVTLLPLLHPTPHDPLLPWLDAVLHSRKFIYSVLGAYSLVNICYTLSRIPSSRTNPSLLMAGSFLVFIVIGSFVLMLPRCTYHGISYADSLFVASSAVSITGLSSVDIPSTFTPLGILVISVLVQLGSLGLITFTSFFAIFFTGNTSIYNQLLLRDILFSKSMNSLIPTLLYVLGFTLVVELIGAAAVFITVPDGLGLDLKDKIVFSAFHSMSSFCNAGFSCLPGGMANAALMHSNQTIYIVTSLLIFAGAVGFPILVNFREILFFYARKAWSKICGRKFTRMRVHIFDLNTKLVLCTTLTILIVASCAFFALEYNNTLAGMSLYEKCVQSVFNSLIPRSAGFASVNPASFLDVTIILVLVQMVIGGSSQSMAGGIKVNTLAAILLNLKSVVLGHSGTSAFNRTINIASIRRANAVVSIAAISLLAYLVAMMLLEHRFSTKEIVFETVSALFTVGSSLGITPYLGDASKVLLSTAMFFGRVGLLSILAGILARTRDISPHLPTDNIIIN